MYNGIQVKEIREEKYKPIFLIEYTSTREGDYKTKRVSDYKSTRVWG